MIGKDEKLWNEVKAFPIFLKVYCAVVLGFVTLINEIIKIFMVIFYWSSVSYNRINIIFLYSKAIKMVYIIIYQDRKDRYI